MNEDKKFEAIFIPKGIFSNARLSNLMEKSNGNSVKINNLVLGYYQTLIHPTPKKVVKISNNDKASLNYHTSTIPILNDLKNVFSHYKSAKKNSEKFVKATDYFNLKNKSMRDHLLKPKNLAKISQKVFYPKKNFHGTDNNRITSEDNLEDENRNYKLNSKFNIKEKENFRIRLQAKLKLKLKYPDLSNQSQHIKDKPLSFEQLKKALQKLNLKRKNYNRNENKCYSGDNPLFQKIQQANSQIFLKKSLSKDQRILNSFKDNRIKLRKKYHITKLNKAHSHSFHEASILIRGIRLCNLND